MMFPLIVEEQANDVLSVVQKRPVIYYLIWGTFIVGAMLFFLFALYSNMNTRSLECHREVEGIPDCFVHEFLFNQPRQTLVLPSVNGIVKDNKTYYLTSTNGQTLRIVKDYGSYLDIQRFIENPQDLAYIYTKNAKISLSNILLPSLFILGCLFGLIKVLQIRSATTIFDYHAAKVIYDSGMPTKKIKEIPLSKVGYVTFYKNPSSLNLRLYNEPNLPFANYTLVNQKVPQYIVDSAALINQWLENHNIGQPVPPHELDPVIIPSRRR